MRKTVTCYTLGKVHPCETVTMESSKLVIIVVVYLSFFLDNTLLTVVVPIIPDFLFSTNENNSKSENALKSLSYLQEKYAALENENGPVGFLLSSKALVQLVVNPLVGYLTGIVGYNFTLIVGSINLLIASLLFAYGQSYSCLLLARSLHGTASSCMAISGMCLIADLYRNETRSKLMGMVLGSVALGVLMGYPLGGVLYDFVGKTAPFVVISVLISGCIVLQISYLDVSFPEKQCLEPKIVDEKNCNEWRQLLGDVPITILVCAIWLSTSSMAILEPCLPLWLMGSMQPPPQKWQLGTVFIPDSLGYLIGTNFTGFLTEGVKKWKVALVSMILVGVCSTIIPSAVTLKQLIIPHLGLGLGIGSIDASLVPLLANMVDSRHGSRYGSAYALQQIAVSLAYFLGPLLGGETVKLIGFSWLMIIVGILNIIFSPFLIILTRDTECDRAPLAPALHAVSYNSNARDHTQSSNYERFKNEDEDDE